MRQPLNVQMISRVSETCSLAAREYTYYSFIWKKKAGVIEK